MSIVRINNLGITDGTIVNADINSAAAIATSKLGAGAVLQVVQGTLTTEVTTSSSTLADIGLSATITPSSASNKILVIVVINGCEKSSAAIDNQLHLSLLRGATTIRGSLSNYTGTALRLTGTVSLQVLDSPSTTSATTYKIQFANFNNTASVTVNQSTAFVTSTSTIILMEIKG